VLTLNAQVEEFDKALRHIVPEEATPEQIAAGLTFTEGPLWYGNYLLFSDIPQNRIVKLSLLSNGPEITTFRSPSGNSNGLTLDKSRRLIACEHGTRRVTRTETDGSIKILAERYQGNRLNSPNDVVVRSDGSVYFTDPSFGLGTPPAWKEIAFNGVFRVAPDGELVLLADDFDLPNGIAFSPDESVLYVNDTSQGHIRAFDVNEEGDISNGRVLIELKGKEVGRPDGMKVDRQGNVYCTGPGGIWIAQPDGRALGRVLMSEQPANFAWGDYDWQTLYITARTGIYRMRMLTPGIAVP